MKQIVKRIINRFLKLFEINSMSEESDIVYLTFDDGPESGITEFVVEELAKYGFKATFFCRGDNAQKKTKLIELLRKEGHSIGNHTYSHLHAYKTSSMDYFKDVDLANSFLHSIWFRPPHGCLTFVKWMKLRKKYNIVYWSLNSEDSKNEEFDYNHAINVLKTKTKRGDLVLFHFCHKHEKNTRILLPEYLKWLKYSGYVSKGLPM